MDVYIVCCRGSNCKDDVPQTSTIAPVGEFLFAECVCKLILPVGSSRFVGLEPCRFSPKSKHYISKAKSLQASSFVTADVNESLIKGQVSTASLVACLKVWCRLPDEWTSLMMPRSKRQPHLEVFFVVGQVV